MFRRGDVFECYLSKETVGSEQGGTRPAVVIQNNKGNKYSPTVIVALITSQNKKKLPTHVKLHGYDNLTDCTVLLEQVRTVDKKRLREYRTTLSEEDMLQIDKALLVSQGININKLINKEN